MKRWGIIWEWINRFGLPGICASILFLSFFISSAYGRPSSPSRKISEFFNDFISCKGMTFSYDNIKSIFSSNSSKSSVVAEFETVLERRGCNKMEFVIKQCKKDFAEIILKNKDIIKNNTLFKSSEYHTAPCTLQENKLQNAIKNSNEPGDLYDTIAMRNNCYITSVTKIYPNSNTCSYPCKDKGGVCVQKIFCNEHAASKKSFNTTIVCPVDRNNNCTGGILECYENKDRSWATVDPPLSGRPRDRSRRSDSFLR